MTSSSFAEEGTATPRLAWCYLLFDVLLALQAGRYFYEQWFQEHLKVFHEDVLRMASLLLNLYEILILLHGEALVFLLSIEAPLELYFSE